MRPGEPVRLATRVAGALLLMGALVLSGACGGRDSSSETDAGTSLGSAEGGAAARATDIARAVATGQATAAAQVQTSAVDPCRVVMKEELEAALGVALQPGERKRGPIGDEQCTYRAQSDQTPGTMPSVTVAIYRSRLARTTYDGVRESASSRATDVPGLGDKAYVFIGGSMPDSREIQVLKGDVLLSINLTAILNPPVSMSEEEKKTKLIALARTALGRL